MPYRIYIYCFLFLFLFFWRGGGGGGGAPSKYICRLQKGIVRPWSTMYKLLKGDEVAWFVRRFCESTAMLFHFVTRENFWQIFSLVTQKSLFMVTHTLFFIWWQLEPDTFVCHMAIGVNDIDSTDTLISHDQFCIVQIMVTNDLAMEGTTTGVTIDQVIS